jgi:hypothetical protein
MILLRNIVYRVREWRDRPAYLFVSPAWLRGVRR